MLHNNLSQNDGDADVQSILSQLNEEERRSDRRFGRILSFSENLTFLSDTPPERDYWTGFAVTR